MPLEEKTGSFISKGSLGSQTIPMSFAGKVVMFYASDQTAIGIANDATICFGAAVSASEEYYSYTSAQDGTTNLRRRDSEDHCI